MDPAPKPSSSGSLSERLLIPAEEEAFLRSLGWEGDDMDDDNEEGDDLALLMHAGAAMLPFCTAEPSWRFYVWCLQTKYADQT